MEQPVTQSPEPRSTMASRCLAVAGLLLIIGAELSRADTPDEPIADFGATYTGEVLSNRKGGLQQASAYLDNLDLTLAIDMERLWGWKDATLFFYGLYNNGEPFSETIVGDLQIVSNIQTRVQALRLFEAWARFPLGDRSELLVGLFDLNSEFDVLEAAQLFTGSAHGIGTDISQAGVNGPSIFPITGFSVRLAHRLGERWTVRGAVVDGVPGDPENPDDTTIRLSSDEGALLITELERSGDRSRVLAGAWGYSAKFAQDPLDLRPGAPRRRRGNAGVYLRGETDLLDGDPSLAMFGRVGYARGDFNVFDFFMSAGLSGRSLLPARPDDEFGLGVAWAETSANVKDLAAAAARSVDSREVAIEFTYRTSFGEHFALQPSLHYIVNPGVDPTLDNAFVIGLRFEASL